MEHQPKLAVIRWLDLKDKSEQKPKKFLGLSIYHKTPPLFSCIWLFMTPRTAACQASLSFTVSESLLKLMSIELMMSSSHLILCRPLLCLPSSFPASGSFQMSQLFTSGGWSIGVSASASVLPVNIQGWFPLGLTGLISLLSKGLSRVFSNTLVQKHQFFVTQLSYSTTLIFVHDYQKNHSFDYSFVDRMMSLLLNMPSLSQLFFQGATVF